MKLFKTTLLVALAFVLSVSFASLVSARGWVQQGGDWYYVDNDGEAITDSIQSSGTAKFYLDPDDGHMVKDYFLEDRDNATYYFGSNGAMVTNTWVAIESSRVDNQGDYVPDNYWYYFQASGKAMKGTSTTPKKTTIDGKKYMFNEFGQMCTGWVKSTGEIVNPDDEDNPFIDATYYCGGDNDGVMRTGWVTYYDGYSGDGDDEEWKTDKTNIYFYFNPSNGKKVGRDGKAETKKINGKTYAFSKDGIMASKWDVFNDDSGDFDNILTLNNGEHKKVYFSGEDDGHQVKKGWVYDVPAQNIDQDAYDDDEEKYMYFASNGEAVTDQYKKINGKYYIFNQNGIMKTGIIVWCPEGNAIASDSIVGRHFVNTLDLDYATGEELSKAGILTVGDAVNEYYVVNPNGLIVKAGADADSQWAEQDDGTQLANKIKLHYHGEDGARKTGTNSVEFSDDTFQIMTNASGDKGSMLSAKKYYQLGIVLKANADIKYGIYVDSIATSSTATSYVVYDVGQFFPQGWKNDYSGLASDEKDTLYAQRLAENKYTVLSTSGSKVKGNNSAKKDADGNYWYISKSTGALVGIWSVNVKQQNKQFNLKNSLWLPKSVFENYKASGITETDFETILDTYGSSNFDHTDVYDDTLTGWRLYSGKDYYTFATWKESKNASGVVIGYDVTLGYTYGGLWFSSDYDGSANKWIPFGFKDDSGKTCWDVFGEGYYQITPNNDYFVNCYWSEQNWETKQGLDSIGFPLS